MTLGDRIRELRMAKGLTQAQLGEMVDSDGNTVSRWERDKLGMRKEYVIKFAQALGTSADYLLGETDDPKRSPQSNVPRASSGWVQTPVPKFTPFNLSRFDMSLTEIDMKGLKKLPLLHGAPSPRNDVGDIAAFAEGDILTWQVFSADIYGAFDPLRPPFIIRVEGDAMDGAGIHDGAVAVINPAEEVRDGDAALVRWHRDQVAIKLVYWRTDGGVELHSADPRYMKTYTFTGDERQTGAFRVEGRVMWVGQRPRRLR